MDDVPTSPCMVAHNEVEKNRHYHVNYAAILFNKFALSENLQMGINTDNLGMGLSAILKGVYQVRAIGSGTTPSVFNHTVPASMTIGKSYQVAFSGVTSAKGAVTYTLSSPANLGSMLGFSKGTGILADEDITVSVNTAVPGNYSLEVLAYAGQTLVSTHTVNFTLVAAVLTGTIAVSGAGGTTTAGMATSQFRFSGVTADVGAVTYSIANSGQSYFTFSKSTNIAAHESITVTSAANTPTGTYNFTISANTSPSASNGPVTATCNQSVTAAVVTPTMSGTIQVNIPSTMTAGATGSLTLSGVTSNIGTPTYSISEQGTSYFTFSKTSGITAGETVSWSLAAGAPTSTVTFNTSANTSPTASNGPMTGTRTVQVNAAAPKAPVLTGVIRTSGVPYTMTAGGSATYRFSGVTADTGTVTYSIANRDQSYFTFSKSTNIAADEAITVTPAANTPTGTYVLNVSANTSPSASNGPMTGIIGQSVTSR